MAKVLYVTANPKPTEHSFTLKLANTFMTEYVKNNPQDEVMELDLFESHIPLIDSTVITAWDKLAKGVSLNEEENSEITRMNEILNQFLGVDKLILAAPMWNFSFPPVVKAYIDNLVIAGKTFQYTENGAVGLVKGKSVLFVQSRGGVFSEGPLKSLECAESYLRNIFSFMGITDFHTLLCEGIGAMPHKADEILGLAQEKAVQLAKTF